MYSSAVERCKQTATIVPMVGWNYSMTNGFSRGFSAYQGFGISGERPPWHDFYSHQSLLGGEKASDVQKEWLIFWQSLSGNTDNLIICSHGDPLYMLYAHLVGVDVSSPATSCFLGS